MFFINNVIWDILETYQIHQLDVYKYLKIKLKLSSYSSEKYRENIVLYLLSTDNSILLNYFMISAGTLVNLYLKNNENTRYVAHSPVLCGCIILDNVPDR